MSLREQAKGYVEDRQSRSFAAKIHQEEPALAAEIESVMADWSAGKLHNFSSKRSLCQWLFEQTHGRVREGSISAWLRWLEGVMEHGPAKESSESQAGTQQRRAAKTAGRKRSSSASR